MRLKYYRKSIVALFPRCYRFLVSNAERNPVYDLEMTSELRPCMVISDATSDFTGTTSTAMEVTVGEAAKEQFLG